MWLFKAGGSVWPCGGRGAGYPKFSEAEPGWEQLRSRGLFSPSWKEGVYHLQVLDKACGFRNLPFPTSSPSFLPHSQLQTIVFRP